MQKSPKRPPGIQLLVSTLALLWVVHAIAFFAHEYAHSITAWLLGWKSNPLALNYGGFNAVNLLVQLDIDENVNYSPIFAAGHGTQAAVIAAAGMVIGNGLITYGVSLWGYKHAKQRNKPFWALACFWLCVASVGNLLSYVPVRTFTSHGDMYKIQQGLSCGPWPVAVVLGIPTLAALVHFLIRFAPEAFRWIFPDSRGQRVITAILTCFFLFGFYGYLAGFSGYGPEAHLLAVICGLILLPLSALVYLFLNW